MLIQVKRARKKILVDEIYSIAKSTRTQTNIELINYAKEIALDFAEENRILDPITLARASFFTALKKFDQNPRKHIKPIINNMGKRNRWWLYLAPLVEKRMKEK